MKNAAQKFRDSSETAMLNRNRCSVFCVVVFVSYFVAAVMAE